MLESRTVTLTRAQYLIVALCFAAALKTLFFSVSLPFFAVDEELHFDAIRKFAAGYQIQPSLPSFDHESAEIIELYQSPQFLKVPDPTKPWVPASWWCHPATEQLPPQFEDRTATWQRIGNVEVDAPPAYYLIAAVWYKLGRLMGYSGLFLLYWLRTLNAVGFGFLILFAWMFVRECYPENSFLQISVPVFLLVFPQDCFLSIIPNSLSATFMGLTLLLCAKLLKRPDRSLWFYLLTGAAAAVTALLGFGNFTVAIPLLWVAWRMIRTHSSAQPQDSPWLKTLAMLTAAALPIGAWLLRNYLVLGNWSGSKSKQEYLTWTVKPLSQLFHHPLFSWEGFSYFVTTLSRNFWRGELWWHGAPRVGWIDPLYLSFSLIFCGTFLFYALKTKNRDTTQSFANTASIMMVAASVLFLMAISLPFDFGRCFYPSQARPYFVSGRIIIGILLPFLIMFLSGLQIACGWISHRLNPLYVALPLAAVIFITETVLFLPILSSRFNLISFILGRSCS
jgi:hypothetical protein